MQLRTQRRLQETVQPLYINLFAALSNLPQGEATTPLAALAREVQPTPLALPSCAPQHEGLLTALDVDGQCSNLCSMPVQASSFWWTCAETCLQPSRLHQRVQPQFGCWLTV